MSHSDGWLAGVRADNVDRALRELAEQQHGVLSREQAHGAGASRDMLRRRLQSPEWDALTSKVLRLAGSADSFQQRCMAGVLDAGPRAVVSHEAAAALWRLPGFPNGLVEVIRAHRGPSRASKLAIVRRTCLLPDHHLTLVTGIPVTSVGRTLFDLVGTLRAGRSERALDNALARGLVTIRSLRVLTAELAEHGRPGSTRMREMVAERSDSYSPPESGLESRFLAVIRSAGLPLPLPQRDLGGDRWVGRADFLYPELSLVVEVDSSIHHSAALDRAADARRDAELSDAGFTVRRFRDAQVWHQPGLVVDELRATLAVLGAQTR